MRPPKINAYLHTACKMLFVWLRRCDAWFTGLKFRVQNPGEYDVPSATAKPSPSGLKVDIYQLAGDEMFAENRSDGTGWTWSWADWRRDWMDRTAHKFAYRCLPLTIANQIGWMVNNPVGFTAIWTGRAEPDGVLFKFDTDAGTWRDWINNQFGHGIVSWNAPFLFRTRPAGSRLMVMGPANHFKNGATPLTAVIESDWMTASFTMNWKLTQPGLPVRFEVGEPLFQALPVATNLAADLEGADVTYQRLGDDRATHDAFFAWKRARDGFKRGQQAGQIDPSAWQKDYFKGQDTLGRPVSGGHMTKVVPPAVRHLGREKTATNGTSSHE